MDSGFDEEVPVTSTPFNPEIKIDEFTEYLGLKRNMTMNPEVVDSSKSASASISTPDIIILENGVGTEESESDSDEGFVPLPPLPVTKKKKKRKRSVHDDEYPDGLESLPQHEQFVEAQTLTVNILNDPYKNPVRMTLFKDMFNCSDCGEVFYSEEGLEDHRNRVTIQAYVRCPYCVQHPKLTYNNRCRLLNHFKNHGVELSLDNLLGHINVQPLSSDPMSYDYSLPLLRNMKATYPTCTITSAGMEVDEDEPEDNPFMEEDEMELGYPVNSGYPKSVPRRNGYTQKMVKCNLCEYQVPIRNLKKHQIYCDPNRRHNDFYCNACSKVFSVNISYVNHSRSHLNAGLNVCMFCYNQDIGAEDLNTHLQLHVDAIEEIPHQCHLCAVTLSELVEIEEHFKAHHTVERKNRFTCAICGQHFDEVKQLVNHRQKNHSYSSTNDGTEAQSQSSKSMQRNFHVSQQGQPAKVVMALNKKNMNSNSRTKMESHNHSHKSNFKYVYKCKYCSRVKPFMSCQGLRKHIKTHHPRVDFSKIDWTKMRKITKESEIKSVEVEEATVTLVNGNHEELPSSYPKSDARPSNGTFTCLKCNDTELDTETSFFDHVKLSHVWPDRSDDNPNFWCPECGVEFIAQTSFKMHLQSEHPFIGNLNKYLESIGYVNPNSVFKKPLPKNQCPICQLQCNNSSEYDNHLTSHEMNNIIHEVTTE